MVLFKVRAGVITVMSVVRETTCGWRDHKGGFINKRRMSEIYHNLSECYYTTDAEEAKKWSKVLTQRLSDTLQCAKASFDDLNHWIDNGSDEGAIPRSRY